MELSTQTTAPQIAASTIKSTFAQESQQYLELLQDLISKLENSLHDIDQLVQPSRKTEEIIRINRLLQESATKADFYKPNSPFVKLSCRLEQEICQLGDRQFVPIIDPIAQDLLQQMLTVMAQLIDDYCQESDDDSDNKNTEFRANREEQIGQLLNQLDQVPSNKDYIYPNEFLNLSGLSNLEGLDSDPFGIDTDSEALHLFDLDTELSSSPDLTAMDLEDMGNTGIAENIDSKDVDTVTDTDQGADQDIHDPNATLPMPELLVNIFHQPSSDKLLGNDDETELQGTVWKHHQEDLTDLTDLTTVAEIIDDWQKPYVPEPSIAVKHEISRQSFLLETINAIRQEEDLTAQNFFGEPVNEVAENTDTAEDTDINDLDNLDSSLDQPPSNDLIEIPENLVDTDDYLSWRDATTYAESETEQESDFFFSFSDASSDNRLESLPDWEISSLDNLDNLDQMEQEEITEIEPEKLSPVNKIEQINQFAQQDFNTLDIDTELEESPIYQSQQQTATNSNYGDRHSNHDLELSAIPETPEDTQNITQTSQVGELSHAEDNYPQANHGSVQASETSGQVLDKILDNYGHGSDLGQDLTVRIQLAQLESLGDLSEEIAVRNSNLDVYLEEMRSLYDVAQKNLHIMTNSDASRSAELQQSAIADLHNNFEQIVGLISHTEQQTKAMVRDIYHLRRSFQQVLRHPISGLVGKFPRILRELSLQQGKQVELIVQGADISIERSLLDVVAEVLHLLLINALESGIETPDERQLQGKSIQGKIEVIAAQADAQTTITVRDDGYGLALSDLSEISKSKLQAHQTKLQEIGASLTMQSRLSQGSEFTLILPHSCSNREIVVITINQISMAVSSNLIVEIIPIDRQKHPMSSHSASQLQWHDHSIPLINLDTFFQLNCRSTPLESNDYNPNYPSTYQWLAYQQKLPAFLIIDYQGHLFALQTDGCSHKQEGIFQQVAGDILLPPMFCGTVILGDSRAVPLLNLSELISRCLRSHPDHVDPVTKEIAHNHNSFQNLSSLSDFFGLGDGKTEPENLESSGLFVNGTEVSQPSHQKAKKVATRVLLVESSANVRRYLAMTLDKLGFITEQVSNTQEAIAFLAPALTPTAKSRQVKPRVDVVISDLDMDNIDSFHLISQIRANYNSKALPIIILTACNGDRDRQTALDRGANAYFIKPYREQELITTLQKLVSP